MEQKTEASQAVDELVRACKAATSDAEKVAAIDAYRTALKALGKCCNHHCRQGRDCPLRR